MKLSATLAFAALSLLSCAIPLEKRQDVTITSTIDLIETVDLVVTVWLPPGGQPAKQALHEQVAQPSQPNPAPAVHTTPVQDAVVPATRSSSAAPQNTQQTGQDQANQTQDQTNKDQAQKNKDKSDNDLAIQNGLIDAQNKLNEAQDDTNKAGTAQNQAVPAPVQSSPAPVAPAVTKEKAPSGQTQPTSGGSCGEIGGSCSASSITYFEGGQGACGWTNDTKTEDFFALAWGALSPSFLNYPSNAESPR